jgi:hypothetical protein
MKLGIVAVGATGNGGCCERTLLIIVTKHVQEVSTERKRRKVSLSSGVEAVQISDGPKTELVCVPIQK